MATFNYTVDTQPMATEIGSVSNHVKGTTAAVVAMQTAVILAENNAANHVCNNVNRGFFTLIRSQISQKLARLQSDVDSHLMQLMQQRKQILAIKGRMDRDYNMISTRYIRLFNGLNSNLRLRVAELDKATFTFASREVDKLANRIKYLTATVPVTQLESLAISQKIIASNVKFRGLKVIHSMTTFLSDMYEQKKLTDNILLPSSTKAENESLFVPVIVNEHTFDRSANTNLTVWVSKTQLNQATRTQISNAVNNAISTLNWQYAEVSPEIESEFLSTLSASGISPRAKEMTGKLFMAANFQTV